MTTSHRKTNGNGTGSTETITTGIVHSPGSSSLPRHVVNNLSKAHDAYMAKLALDPDLKALEPLIAEAAERLRDLTEQHKQLGTKQTELEEDARGFHEMAVDHCHKYGYGPMPASFEEMVQALKESAERLALNTTSREPAMRVE